ncbi:MAG TPA: response regulator [Candidatus Saccharimonadales bacterium]
MAKILLVEDDNNLREIYQARLMAEGYEISTAQNGEEALVVAKQQKPDLIISDVMMPRISGFEMLDILRNTAELKNTKVIMLTALGQDDDQKRAGNLGADRYLVKSQVTLEDIVNASKELLSGDSPTQAPRPQPAGAPDPLAVAPAAPGIPAVAHVPDPTAPGNLAASANAPDPVVPPAPQPVATQPAAAPAAPDPVPAADPAAAAPTDLLATPPHTAAPVSPVTQPVAVVSEPSKPVGPTAPATPPTPATVSSAAQGLEAEEAALQAQIASYANAPAGDTPKAAPAPDSNSAADTASNDKALADAVKQLNTPDAGPGPAAAPTPGITPAAPSAGGPLPPASRKAIEPITDPAAKPDLNALLAKEEAKNAPGPAATPPAAPSGSTPSGQPFDPTTSL